MIVTVTIVAITFNVSKSYGMSSQFKKKKTFPFIAAGDNRERILRGADPLADEQQGHPGRR